VATVEALGDSTEAAIDLAAFLLALQQFKPGAAARERSTELTLGRVVEARRRNTSGDQ